LRRPSMKDTTSMPPPQEFIANERRLSPSAPPTPREYAEAALVYGRDEDPGSVFPQVHASRAKTPKREVKLKESKDLRAFSSALKALLRDPSADVPSKEARDFVKIREVLKSHRLSADGDDDDASLDSLNVALFSGCKLQLKPVAWNQEGAAEAVQVYEPRRPRLVRCGSTQNRPLAPSRANAAASRQRIVSFGASSLGEVGTAPRPAAPRNIRASAAAAPPRPLSAEYPASSRPRRRRDHPSAE